MSKYINVFLYIIYAVEFVGGAGLYSCWPAFLNPVITAWPLLPTTHLAKSLAILG